MLATMSGDRAEARADLDRVPEGVLRSDATLADVAEAVRRLLRQP